MNKQRLNSRPSRIGIVTLLFFAQLFMLIGCGGNFDPADAFDEGRIPMEPLLFRQVYSGEIVEQVLNYEVYVNINEAWLRDSADDIALFDLDILPNMEYVVGQDIVPGRYLVMGAGDCGPLRQYFRFERTGREIRVHLDGQPGSPPRYMFVDREIISIPTSGQAAATHLYIYLLDGDIVPIQGENVMFANATSRPPLTAHDGVYPEAAFSVPNEISPGLYFAIQIRESSAIITNDGGRFSIIRFGYVEVKPDDTFVQLENCVLIPVELKPQILPLTRNGAEYFGQGTYKVGADIPLGTYTIQTDLFTAGRELNINSTKGLVWIGYVYYDSGLSEVYQRQFTSYRGRLVMRTTTVDGFSEYEFISQLPELVFDQEGEYIRLIRTRLAR